jgi:uncharacterized protein YbbC (DUF1343 family)
MGEWGFNGVKFTPFRFKPPTGKYRHITMSGAKVTIDRQAPANLTAINIAGLAYLRRMMPKKNFFVDAENTLMFDKLNRSRETRKQILSGMSSRQIVASWEPGVQRWREERKPYLLYPETLVPARKVPASGPARLKP